MRNSNSVFGKEIISANNIPDSYINRINYVRDLGCSDMIITGTTAGRESVCHRQPNIEGRLGRSIDGRLENSPRSAQEDIHEHERLKFFPFFMFFSSNNFLDKGIML